MKKAHSLSFPVRFDLVLTFLVTMIFVWFFMIHYIVGGIFLLLVFLTVTFWLKQKEALFWLGVFFVFQPLIVQLTRMGIVARLDEVMIIFFCFLSVVKRIVERKPLIVTSIDKYLWMLMFWGMMGSFLHHIVSFGITLGGFLLFVKGFMLFYIFTNVDFQKDDLEIFLKRFLWLGVIICVHGFLTAIWPKIFLYPLGFFVEERRFGLVSAQSILGHPGAYAAFMAILACYSTAYGLIKGERTSLFLTILFVIAMIVSLRRTSLLGFVVAFLLTVSFQFKGLGAHAQRLRSKYMLVLFLLLVLFSGFIAVMYVDVIHSYLVIGDSPRAALFKSGIKIALNFFPFGSGFGTFGSGINQAFYSPLFYQYGLNRIWGLSPDRSNFINDTFWPHVLAETGFLGLIFYVCILVGMFRICAKAQHHQQQDMLKIFSLAAYMALLVSIVESSKATFYEMSLWTYFYFGPVAILASLNKRDENYTG